MEEAQERNILSSIPILKFIDEKEIDVLTVENENNLSTTKQRKLCISVNTEAKVIRRSSHLQSIYQNVQLLIMKHHQKMKV